MTAGTQTGRRSKASVKDLVLSFSPCSMLRYCGNGRGLILFNGRAYAPLTDNGTQALLCSPHPVMSKALSCRSSLAMRLVAMVYSTALSAL
jgi:hypothetical protein